MASSERQQAVHARNSSADRIPAAASLLRRASILLSAAHDAQTAAAAAASLPHTLPVAAAAAAAVRPHADEDVAAAEGTTLPHSLSLRECRNKEEAGATAAASSPAVSLAAATVSVAAAAVSLAAAAVSLAAAAVSLAAAVVAPLGEEGDEALKVKLGCVAVAPGEAVVEDASAAAPSDSPVAAAAPLRGDGKLEAVAAAAAGGRFPTTPLAAAVAGRSRLLEGVGLGGTAATLSRLP